MEHIIVYLLIIGGGYFYYFLSIKWLLKSSGKWPIIIGIIVGIIVNLILIFTRENIYEKISDVTFIVYLITFLKYYFEQLKNNKLSPITYLMITAIVFSISSGFSSSYKILEKESKLNYELKFKDYSIQTSSDLRYLGKTEVYSFFYYKEKKQSRIVSNQDLMEINIFDENN